MNAATDMGAISSKLVQRFVGKVAELEAEELALQGEIDAEVAQCGQRQEFLEDIRELDAGLDAEEFRLIQEQKASEARIAGLKRRRQECADKKGEVQVMRDKHMKCQ